MVSDCQSLASFVALIYELLAAARHVRMTPTKDSMAFSARFPKTANDRFDPKKGPA